MKLSEMRQILDGRGIQLTKSLGQNFLHDQNQLRRIVEAGELSKNDRVLEIGPGLGPLTELILAKAGEVLAIEMDARLVNFLKERFSNFLRAHADVPPHPGPLPRRGEGEGDRSGGRLQLIHADALLYIKREQRDWSGWKLVANLPYSVASPILVELALGKHQPERMVVTLQLEVAQRLMSDADDDDYGVLTLLVQLDYEAHEWFKIPSECFFPSPGVDSGCVVLVRRPEPLVTDEERVLFVKIVKRAFSQRRKMMMKLLRQDWPAEKLVRAFEELKISPQERAEKLRLEQFVALTKILQGD